MKQLLRSGCWGRVGWAVVWTGMALNCPLGLAQGFNRTATKFYPDFSDTADALLRNAASHAREGQWAEAVDIYQRVIQQFGDKVARLPKDDPAGDPSGESVLFVDLRQFCQRRLAALPPAGRAIYRSRVDVQAERWYRQGAAERDRGLLRRVVEQAFCSVWGDDALELLGDLAFQDGRFDEALAMYRQLVPDQPRRPVRADPSRPERRPGPGRRQEAPLPRGRGRGPARSRRTWRRSPPRTRMPPGAWPAGPVPMPRHWPRRCGSTTWRPPPSPTAAGRRSPARRRGPRSFPGRSTSGRSSGGSTSSRVRPQHLESRHGRARDGRCRRSGSPTTGSWPIIRSSWATRSSSATSNRIIAYNLNDRPTGPPGSTLGALKRGLEARRGPRSDPARSRRCR